jgi:exodeoxyribonuclease VII large subunit
MKPITISEFVHEMKYHVESEFRQNYVMGEISNLSSSAAGHWYFTLSDADASISCALFKMDAMRNPMIRKAKDGDMVIIQGPVSLYAKRGNLQIIVKKISKEGKGDLAEQFEKLKAKLAKEGLFDLAKKKPIPLLPTKIAVITAEQGAALQDFLNVFKRRSLWHDIVVIPAVVQGEKSAASMMKALDKVAKLKPDVCVLTRGGGSLEDLWSFNDEAFVRKVSDFPIPTVSAVGHQVDFTLCDFVSDLRCETPTAAAEILTQEQTKINEQLKTLSERLLWRIQSFTHKLNTVIVDYHPSRLLGRIQTNISVQNKRLDRLNLKNRMYELSGFYDSLQRVDEASYQMKTAFNHKFEKNFAQIEHLNQMLLSLNPNNVLGRGYSYIVSKDEGVITSKKDFDKLNVQSNLEVQFHDGKGQVQKI